MNAEEQLRKLKQVPALSREEKRKKIITSVVLAIATLVSVLFLVYAFMQKLEADQLRIEAEQFRMEAERQKTIAEQNEAMAMASRAEAERQRALAEQALEDCRKSKR